MHQALGTRRRSALSHSPDATGRVIGHLSEHVDRVSVDHARRHGRIREGLTYRGESTSRVPAKAESALAHRTRATDRISNEPDARLSGRLDIVQLRRRSVPPRDAAQQPHGCNNEPLCLRTRVAVRKGNRALTGVDHLLRQSICRPLDPAGEQARGVGRDRLIAFELGDVAVDLNQLPCRADAAQRA